MTVPRGLHSTERQMHLCANGRGVDVGDARVEIAHGGERLVHVLGVDGRRQAVLDVVGNLDRALQAVARDDGNDRPEDLFLRNAHLGIDVSKHRGRNEPAVAVSLAFQTMSPAQHLRAFILPILMYFRSVSICDELTAGPMSTLSSRPLPTFSFLARATSSSMNFLYTLFCTMMRLVAVQRCPVVPKAPHSAPSRARSRLASPRTIIGFLPPSSSEQCLKLLAASCPTTRPTAVDPVRETARTSGCSTIGVPTSPPNPVTMLTTPVGMPASCSACTKLKTDNGVSCAGLMTAVLPATSAGNSFHDGIAMGKFHGVIMAQTPNGWRMAMANLLGSSEGTVGPNNLRPSPAV